MVKKTIIFLVLCSFILLIGCGKEQLSQQVEVKNIESNYLNLRISKPEGQNYIDYKKIDDIKTVKMVMDILINLQWEKVKVSMSRQPDYKIVILDIAPNNFYIPVTYSVWRSPKKDLLEVIIEDKSKYGKVTKEDFKKLLSIL